jgi:hypothetical protein
MDAMEGLRAVMAAVDAYYRERVAIARPGSHGGGTYDPPRWMVCSMSSVSRTFSIQRTVSRMTRFRSSTS